MVGCRYNAKNTLDRNYLFFAEKLGAEILPETLVTLLEPDGNGGYLVHTRRSTRKLRRGRRTLRAHNVVLAAGAMGTTDLLLRCREAGTLPSLPQSLGHYVRSNSEVLGGTTARRGDVNYSEGIAIASGFYATPDTHLEVVRYSEGSDFMSFLATLQIDDGTRLTRPLKWIWTCLRHPARFPPLPRAVRLGQAHRDPARHADGGELLAARTTAPLVLAVHQETGKPARPRPASDPELHPGCQSGGARHRRIHRRIPRSAINEVALNVPMTAHILGGACMGTGPDRGVVDEHNRVFGHDGLWVVDGAAVPANLGINPSLTITAIAEHAMSAIPPKDPAKGSASAPAAGEGGGGR